MKWLVLVLLMGFVSAVEVDFDCPDDIYVGEEFECSLEVSDGDGVYDVKVEVDKERSSILRIFDSGDWKSGYYYLKEFIEDGDEEDVKLKILEKGRYDVILKLRQGSYREEFDVGRLKVLVLEEEDEEEEEESEEVEKVERLESEVVVLERLEPAVISLNGDVVIEDEGWGYVSKDGWIVDWLLYGFCLFMIFLVGILVLDKF
ncbi:hypothetical protein K8R30_00680 [archaeon]|nr:hypothetical protein [archaeon]